VAIGIGLAPTVSLSDKYLQVGRANISTNLISKASEIPASEAFMERGAKLNPKAYFRFQLGVKGLVKVEINDPADPTPYWLFASRNPDLVVGYLNKKV
jgi:hypothetical protein